MKLQSWEHKIAAEGEEGGEESTEVAKGNGLPATIHCTLCDQDKLSEAYYPSSRGNQTGQCKACVTERQRQRQRERVERGEFPRARKSRAKVTPRKKKPPKVNPESLFRLAGGMEISEDPHLDAAMRIVTMQQKTIELLLERKK